jgi:hypothetical protein
MSRSTVFFVDFVGYFESALDLGLTLDDGLKELMDNSCDFGAKRINIIVEHIEHPTELDHKGKSLLGIRLYVIDDGRGMPVTMKDSGGREYQGLPFAMSFGGREQDVEIEGHRRRIGKFGEGLSATLSCLARKNGDAIVWTKQDDDPEWRHVPFRYQDIIDKDCLLPAESTDLEPDYLPFAKESGTVVRIDTYEGHRQRLGSLQNMLMKYTARTYRHRLVEGLQIKVSVEPAGSHKNTRIRDPLCRLEGSEEVEQFGKAHEFDPIVLTFDGEGEDTNPVSEYGRIDDADGNPVQVRIESTWMDPIAVDRALFQDPSQRISNKKRDKKLKTYGIGRKGQGFSFIRDGREIVGDRSKGLYNKHGMYNYMHGEVHFPPELDQLFGVQTNKSRFSMDKELNEIIGDHILTICSQVRNKQADSADGRKAIRAGIMESQVESDVRTLAPRLPVPVYTREDVDAGEAFRKEARRKMRERLETSYTKQMRHLDNKVGEMTDEEMDNERYKHQQRLEELLRMMEQRYGSRAPVRIDVKEIDDCKDNALYDVDLIGDETVVYMQATSPLYALMKPAMKSEKDLAYALKLFLGSLGYAEHLDCRANPSAQEMWADTRHDISSQVYKMLDILREQLDNEEVEA